MVSQRKEPGKRVDPAVRRAHIIEEAIHYIGECGYHGFNLHDLAKRCQLSNGGVLYHFPSKEHLFLSMLEHLHAEQERILSPLVTELEQQLSGQGAELSTLRELLHCIALAGFNGAEATQVFLRLKLESQSPEHPAHDYFSQIEARIRDLLVRSLTGKCDDPLRSARQLQACLDGLLMVWLREQRGFHLVDEVDAILDKLLPAQQPE